MMDLWTLPMWLRLVWCTPFVRACDILCARVLRTATTALVHLQKGNEATAEGEAFATEDIQAILANRTEKRQIGSKAGNTFSTATFAVTEPTVSAAAGKRLDSFAMRWLNMRLACFGHLWVDNNAANGAVL